MNLKKVKFSDELKLIMKSASEYARTKNHGALVMETVIFHIIKYYFFNNGESESITEVIKDFSDYDRENLLRILEKEVENSTSQGLIEPGEAIPLDSRVESSILRARNDNALKLFVSDNDYIIITTGDLLNALLYENEKVVDILNSYGFERVSIGDFDNGDISVSVFGGENIGNMKGIESVINALKKELFGKDNVKEEKKNSSSSSPNKEDIAEAEQMFENAGTAEAIQTKKVSSDTKTPNLDQFATDMTKKALEGKFDPVIGRDLEITKIIEAISCKKKNNVLLLGNPGTGKSSVVELLAQKIAKGDVPFELRDKRIFDLDLNSMIAGTQFRGQYEERLQNVIEEVVKAKNIIVFIDEFHNLIGHGGGRDGQGADQILKPYLARGEFQCIGSTTEDEYRKLVENDKALDRRFQPIMVEEPSLEETKIILNGIADNYSKFHKVKYTPEVINACVEWSDKYINDLFFPDKAIGVLDKASSKAKLLLPSENIKEVELLTEKKAELKKEKLKVFYNGNPNDWDKIDNINSEITKISEEIESKKSSSDDSKWPTVTVDHVSTSISELSGVPIDKIMSSDMIKIKSMYSEFKEKIIGQDEAVLEITKALQRNILGLRDPSKPIASFLFVGGTGVGKSLIAKILAKEFMGSEKNLETIACSEYMQDWAESKLLGSAPGYVGFSNTKPRLYVLKRKPYCVLLIDEIEKSSSNLYNIWLQMLEEGDVTLSTGEKLSLKNCIIIFTGNVGTKSLELKGAGLGFNKPSTLEEKKKLDTETVMKEVKKEFRPEFLNRLTKIVVFNPLGKEELEKIFYLELAKLQDRLKDRFTLEVSDEVRDFIISKCEPQYGARSLQRLIIENIEETICTEMLETDITNGLNHAIISMSDDEIVKVKFVAMTMA